MPYGTRLHDPIYIYVKCLVQVTLDVTLNNITLPNIF